MLFSASRHVVSIIRFSHHDGCHLVHPNTWYHLNAIRHQDGCRLVHPAKWDISSIPYTIMTDADWCIPPSGTLETFRGAFMTDADLCISSGGSFIYQLIHIYDGFRLLNPVLIIIHIHSIFNYHISYPYSLSYSHL